MTPDRNPAWEGNWQTRIYQEIRHHGCETVQEFLDKFPGIPYSELADKLGSDLAPVQLQSLHFQEAREADTIRLAAKDGLVRKLRENLKSGWSMKEPARSKALDTYAVWASMVEVRSGCVTGDVLLSVWRSLERLAPPEGWLPQSSSDPILQEAFDKGWPPSLGALV